MVVIVRFVVNDKLSRSLCICKNVFCFLSTQTKESVHKSSNTAAQLYSQGKHICKLITMFLALYLLLLVKFCSKMH